MFIADVSTEINKKKPPKTLRRLNRVKFKTNPCFLYGIREIKLITRVTHEGCRNCRIFRRRSQI